MMNSDMTISLASLNRLFLSTGFLRETLEQAGPAAAERRLHQHLRDRLLADAVIMRPPARQSAGEDFEGVRDRRVDANGLAHRRDDDPFVHFFLSGLLLS